jgi:hypothetical protein
LYLATTLSTLDNHTNCLHPPCPCRTNLPPFSSTNMSGYEYADLHEAEVKMADLAPVFFSTWDPILHARATTEAHIRLLEQGLR